MHTTRALKCWPLVVSTIIVTIVLEKGYGLVLPEPKVEILLPRGLRVSIPDTPGLGYFAFHGAVNRPLEGQDTGDFYGNITQPVEGRWTYENMEITLNAGDMLNFWVHIKHNRNIYRLIGRSITVPQIQPMLVQNNHSMSTFNNTRQDYDCMRVPSTVRPRTQIERLKVTICLTTSRS